MTANSADSYQLSSALCLVFILLVPFAIAGLALINTGLGRSRSAAHAMTSALCVICVAVVVYFVCGFAIQGYRPTIILGGAHVLLPTGFFLRGLAWESPISLLSLTGLFSVALSSLIPVGAAADRWRLGAACVSTIFLAGVTFPLFACFAWHARVALLNFGSVGFIDAGGSGVIQATGGLTALSLAWLLDFVLFGCMLAWIGWLGLNSAGAILYTGLQPEKSVLVALNTTFSAAAAALAAAAVTRVRFRRPDASLIANGWMAGLVASSAGCATLKPAAAILTGLVVGVLVVLSVEWLEFGLKVDDPCGSVSVHAMGGIWGLLAAGVFSGDADQFMAQLVGVATLIGFILPITYGLNWLLGRVIPHRVSADGERQGMDLHELGADAYPVFVVHADEFTQR